MLLAKPPEKIDSRCYFTKDMGDHWEYGYWEKPEKFNNAPIKTVLGKARTLDEALRKNHMTPMGKTNGNEEAEGRAKRSSGTLYDQAGAERHQEDRSAGVEERRDACLDFA